MGGVSVQSLEPRRLLAAHIVGNPTVYATIQAAVDAAPVGATINVDAGVYEEMVTVFKTLTIRGAQVGVDARSNVRVGANESIVRGFLTATSQRSPSFDIRADNVVLDGFTVQDNSSQNAGGAGIIIAPNRFGTQILNNIVKNNIAGLLLSNNSTTVPAIIRRNVFAGNNQEGNHSGRGIYTDGGYSGGTLTNVIIDQNIFASNFGGPLTTTSVEGAISLQAGLASSQTNIDITNNVFDSNGKAFLIFNADDVDIVGNVATYQDDNGSAAFRFEGDCHDILVQNNTIYGNTAPGIRIDEKAVIGDNSGFVITGNNIYANGTGADGEGLIVNSGTYSGLLVAENNWWGAASGPGGDGPGTGNKVKANGNNVDFTPWATSPTHNRQSPYFGVASAITSTIQIEDYDHGGEGVAYHDFGPANAGGAYRPNQGVDLQATTDAGGGYNMFAAEVTEYLAYTVTVAQAGTYRMAVRVATGQTTGGTFHLDVGGSNVSGAITVPNTGGSQVWQTITDTGIHLAAGTYPIKLVMDTGGSSGLVGNFNWYKFTLTQADNAPPSNLAASAMYSTIRLAWQDNSPAETGFAIERKIGTGAFSAYASVAANVTTFTDTQVAPGLTYTYRVRATAAGGDSGNSNESSATFVNAQAITYISDMTWVSSSNGWGPAERDRSNGGIGASDGNVITLNGVKFMKGIGAHAGSDIVLNLGGQYSSFMASIGVDDEVVNVGATVIFQVLNGATPIYTSPVMLATSITQSLKLNVTGVQQLTLRVTDAGDGIDFDHADWADAKLVKSAAPSAPSALTAAAISSSQINLNWIDTVTNETGFKVLRSTDSINFEPAGTTAAGATTFSDTGRNAGTTYQYRVLAFNAAGDGLSYTSAAATTPASLQSKTSVAPPPPTPVTFADRPIHPFVPRKLLKLTKLEKSALRELT